MTPVKNLRNKFERFCYENRYKGIANLMLYVSIASAIVYVLSMMDQSYTLYGFLCFDRTAILHGQIWRLFTYPLTYGVGSGLIMMLISLFCYYSLGRAIENTWGTFRFNLFYFSGMLLMDIFCLIFGGHADAYHLNLTLFLAYATLYPNAQFLLMFIIPVKAWIFALLDLVLVVYDIVLSAYGPFPLNLFPLVAIANYLLFFGKDVINIIPDSWQANFSRIFRKKKKYAKDSGPIPFPSAGSYEATVATAKAPYTHRCTICGRTDVSDPNLEFRYCSRCNGYFCYCEDHINNHTHITEE